MRQNIRLYIEGREVEFSQPPAILYNYKEKELRNPTIVKNSYSKSLDIEGTNSNNDLFGNIWRFDRVQEYHSFAGIGFNPSIRAKFELYVNSELYEKGYCKLDKITKTGDEIKYSITLYGGIGNWIWGLSNGDSDQKLGLGDLDFGVDLDFTISKDTVQEAWNQLGRVTDSNKKWDVINFAVTSEGVPDDFGADRVLYNSNGNAFLPTSSGDYHTILNGVTSNTGYSLIETKGELTMDTAFDLRSYLLRPVVSVRSVFEALQRPANSHGYELDLDEHFFNYQNPYYADAWMTLPRLKDLNIDAVNSSSVQATMTKSGYKNYNLNFAKPSGSENAEVTFNVKITPTGSTTATTLYAATYCKTNLTGHNSDWYIIDYQSTGGLVIVLEALDGVGNVIRTGTPILVDNRMHSLDNELKNLYDQWHKITVVSGQFELKNGTFVLCDEDGNTLDIHTSLDGGADYESLRLVVTNPYVYYATYTKNKNLFRNETEHQTYPDYIANPMPFYTDDDTVWTGTHTLEEVQAHNRVLANWGLTLVDVKADINNYDGFFSGTRIPASKLLQAVNPATFVIDYCKLFGLYFYMDPTEDSAEPQKFPNGVIHIMDRDTFYTDEFVNVNELIDRKKAITINPRTAESKWYSFTYEDGEGDAEVKYRDNYGYDYGRQLVNTNSDFSLSVTELLEGTMFRNGVMVREKNPYFTMGMASCGYMYDGFDYHLFKASSDGWDGNDLSYTTKRQYGKTINNEGFPYYDCFPKLQVHNNENGAEDGSGILLFFDKFLPTLDSSGDVVYYNLTDDLSDMGLLNDGEPCWIHTIVSTNAAGQTIAIRRSTLPFFTRDLYSEDTQGNIIHSWNFGHPKDTFVPRTYSTDFDSICDKTWADYLSDLYDDDTKVVKASVFLGGKPNPSWLRRFYWWDNALWVINTISDWNVCSYDPTSVEFIKVQDTDNYKLTQITHFGRIQIILNYNTIAHTGGSITGKVLQQTTTGTWAFADHIKGTYSNGDEVNVLTSSVVSPTTGSGVTTNITITMPANASALPITYELKVLDGEDQPAYAYFTQEGDNSPFLRFNTSGTEINATTTAYTANFTKNNIQQNSITYAVSYTGQQSNWITAVTVNESNGTVAFETTQNSGLGRGAVITLSGTGIDSSTVTTAFEVWQMAGESETSVYPDHLEFNFNEYSTTEKTVTLTIGSNWTITTQDQ